MKRTQKEVELKYLNYSREKIRVDNIVRRFSLKFEKEKGRTALSPAFEFGDSS